jgi:hypothetical protein
VATTPTPAPPPPPAPRPSNNETINVAGAGAGNAASGELVITSSPNATANAAAAKTAGTPAATPAKSTPTAAPAAPAVNTALNTPPKQSQPSATVATAGTQVVGLAATSVMVQLSSQKTDDGARATYKDLQAHYPKILGSYDVNVQRADLGDRGVYYRARIGPFSGADAKRLCDDLKSAGGDCLLTN